MGRSQPRRGARSYLYRRFGESGSRLAMHLIAGLVVLAGLAWIGFALWRNGPGARRLAARLQSVVETRRSGAPPAAR